MAELLNEYLVSVYAEEEILEIDEILCQHGDPQGGEVHSLRIKNLVQVRQVALNIKP